MSTKYLGILTRRHLSVATAVLGAAGAFTFGFAPAASARPLSEAPVEQPIQVTVTHQADYTNTTCAADLLEARCLFDIQKGDVSEFTVRPRNIGKQITVRVLAAKGGEAEVKVEGGTANLCFVSAGSQATPTLTQVECVAK